MMQNFGLKIVSVALATALAVFVHYRFVNEENNSSVLQLVVPVEVRNLPEDRILIAPETRSVEVTIRGPSLSVSRVVTSPPVFRLSVPSDAKNTFTWSINREDLNLPPDVEVLKVRPTEMHFVLDNRITRKLPVVVLRLGTLSEGLTIGKITASPEQVEVRGPEQQVRRLTQIETEPLDLRSVSASEERVLVLRSPGDLVMMSVPEVRVSIEVVSNFKERVFKDLPIEVRSPSGASFTVEPRTVTVEISGPGVPIDKLQAKAVVPYVRLGSDTPKEVEQVVQAEVPNGMSVVRIDPPRVRIVGGAPPERGGK